MNTLSDEFWSYQNSITIYNRSKNRITKIHSDLLRVNLGPNDFRKTTHVLAELYSTKLRPNYSYADLLVTKSYANFIQKKNS